MEEQNISNNPFTEVPFEVYDVLGTTPYNMPSEDRDMIKGISDWAFKGVEFADGVKKITDKISELGSPRMTDKTYSKLGRWVMLQKQIESLKTRQEAV